MRICLICSLFVLLSAGADAQLTKQPPGIAAGSQYRLSFITSTVRDALSDDIEDYNNFVQQTADAAPVVGSWGLEWKAIVSTLTVAARDNTGTNQILETGVPIYRVDGKQIWRDNEHLWDQLDFSDVSYVGRAINPFNVTELGTTWTEKHSAFWSGNRPDGRSLADFGDSQSSALGGNYADVGIISDFSDPWFSDTVDSELGFPMLAISEVITAVPEPSSGLSLLLTTAAAIGVCRRRRHGIAH